MNIEKEEDQGKYHVEVLGFDYYNTRTGIVYDRGSESLKIQEVKE